MEKVLPKVEMLSSENYRERVLSVDKERCDLAAAPAQSYLLRDVTTDLLARRRTPAAQSRWHSL